MSETIKEVSSKKVQWLITALLTAAIYMIPLTNAYTSQMRAFLCITVCLILMVVFDLVGIMVVGVALPMA